MKNKIIKVEKDKLGEELGLEVGDSIISINGTEIKDIIDYRFLLSDEYVEIEVEKSDGEVWILEVEKDYQEDLGIEFEMGIMDKARSCSNKCMFCFIDQLPKGMRETLYFKDDDSRLSFLQGNFVTLTNMKDEDIDRIIRYRISPINISVHTTNPDLRVKMLKNRFAGKVYDRMKRLADAGIQMNAQLVVIPGINNQEELHRTVEDLYSLYPAVKDVAAVPIGITKYREGLPEVEIFTAESAKKEIESLMPLQEKYIKEIGSPFIRLADEFYVMAGVDIPENDFYGNYGQIEDGIGMIRLLRDTINDDISKLKRNVKGSFDIVTGTSAYDEIQKVADIIMSCNPKIKIKVHRIINNFFGETITVAGLLTGKDITEQTRGKLEGDYLIMSNNMFRKGYELAANDEQIMLDDFKVKDIEEELGKKVIICSYTGDDLIDLINKHCKEV